MKKLFAFCLLGLLFLACTQFEPQEGVLDKAAVAEEIKAFMKSYGEAWTTDADVLLKHCLSNEDFIFYSDKQFYGFNEWEGVVHEMFASGVQYEGFPYKEINVRVLSEESAFFTSMLDYIMIDTAGVKKHIGGGVTYILVKESDEWKIIHGIANHYVME